jgi:hypothetical protein
MAVLRGKNLSDLFFKSRWTKQENISRCCPAFCCAGLCCPALYSPALHVALFFGAGIIDENGRGFSQTLLQF